MNKTKYIVTLSKNFQNYLKDSLKSIGLNNKLIQEAMDGKICDLENTIDIDNIIKFHKYTILEALEICIEGTRFDFKTEDYKKYFLQEIAEANIDIEISKEEAKALIIKGIKNCTGNYKIEDPRYKKAVINIVKNL